MADASCKTRSRVEGRNFVAGRNGDTRRAVRSLPLTKWAPILRVPNVHYVDLQDTDSQAELAALEASLGVHVHSWQDKKK